jgi:hypothetical protein
MATDWAKDVIAGVERWAAVGGAQAVDTLLDGLRAAGPAPLAQALAERRPAGRSKSDAAADGLLGAQAEAFRACLAPGVRLVWAPQGSDTATVLAHAVQALVDQGKRVLLVSPANVAVEEALREVVRRMTPQAGVVVRVGQEVAADPGVRLERLVARACREADEERAAVAAELREIEEIDAEVGRLRVELGDFDEPAHRAAAARVTAECALDELRPRLQEAEAAADVARRAAVAAATGLRAALDARAALDPLREALEHERRAVDGLAALEQRQRALREGRAALAAQEPSRGWAARRRHRRQVDAADAELRRFTAAAAAGRRRWLDVQLQARAVIGERGRSDVDEADLRAADAARALAAADEEYRRARELLIELRGAIDEAEAEGRPTDDDRRLVADAEARGLPARHARLRALARVTAGREAIEGRYRELDDRARAMRADAEARIVGEARVVAATLVRSRVHPALARAAFDVVLVDGAGVAALAEVLLVLCRATTTAVLFGDARLGPMVPDDPSPAYRRWVRGTCFSHLGIESAADAATRAGCVVLTDPLLRIGIPEQRRSSPRLPAVPGRRQ